MSRIRLFLVVSHDSQRACLVLSDSTHNASRKAAQLPGMERIKGAAMLPRDWRPGIQLNTVHRRVVGGHFVNPVSDSQV